MSRIAYYKRQNTTPTAATAPYTIAVVNNGVENLNDIAAKLSLTLGYNELRIKAVVTTLVEKMIENAKANNSVYFGDLCYLKPTIAGGADFIDSPFDPNTQVYELAAYNGTGLADALASVTPYEIKEDEVGKVVRFNNVMDVESERFGVVIGTKQAELLGNGITVDSEGESIKLLNAKTLEVEATAEIDTVSKGQRAKFHFATAPAAGKYYLQLTTFGLLSASTPFIYRKPVTVETDPTPPSPPTITNVTNTHTDEPWQVTSDAESVNKITGTNLSNVTGKIKWLDGEAVEHEANIEITSQTATEVVFAPFNGPGGDSTDGKLILTDGTLSAECEIDFDV